MSDGEESEVNVCMNAWTRRRSRNYKTALPIAYSESVLGDDILNSHQRMPIKLFLHSDVHKNVASRIITGLHCRKRLHIMCIGLVL